VDKNEKESFKQVNGKNGYPHRKYGRSCAFYFGIIENNYSKSYQCAMYMEQSFSNPNSRTQLSAERGVSRQIPGAQKALDVILTPRQKCWKDVVIYGLFHSFHFDHITRVRGNFTERKICPWPGKVENCRHSKLIEYYEHFQML